MAHFNQSSPIRCIGVGLADDLGLVRISCLRIQTAQHKGDKEFYFMLHRVPVPSIEWSGGFASLAYFLLALRIKQISRFCEPGMPIIAGLANTPAASLVQSFSKDLVWRKELLGSPSQERLFMTWCNKGKKKQPKRTDGKRSFNLVWGASAACQVRIYRTSTERPQIELRDGDPEIGIEIGLDEMREVLGRLVKEQQSQRHRKFPYHYRWQDFSIPGELLAATGPSGSSGKLPDFAVKVRRLQKHGCETIRGEMGDYIPEIGDELTVSCQYRGDVKFHLFWISAELGKEPSMRMYEFHPVNRGFYPESNQLVLNASPSVETEGDSTRLTFPSGQGIPIDISKGLETAILITHSADYSPSELLLIKNAMVRAAKKNGLSAVHVHQGCSSASLGGVAATLEAGRALSVGQIGSNTSWSEKFVENLDVEDFPFTFIQIISIPVIT